MSRQCEPKPSISPAMPLPRSSAADPQLQPPAERIERALPPAGASNDPGAALAKADRGIALAPAMRTEDHLVAGFKIGAGLAGGQADGAGAGGAELAQTAVALCGWPRNRAAAEDVAGQQVAAAAG